MRPPIGQAAPESLPATLIRWYDEAARDLPWRAPGTSPWAVLVSEVMLQQTPVARVLPAYAEWLARWPTPATQAADPAGEAVRAWGRLGYPRRALRLHAAATAIVDRHGGAVPAELDELLALPGVGEYTARAVASFAFRQRHAVLDTNVRRVLARAAAGLSDAGPSVSVEDRRRAEALLPEDGEGAAHFGVAVMELGALVCTARQPRCPICPIAERCAWRATGHPATPGAGRRPQAYVGTDRQVRGRLLALLRAADEPLRDRDLREACADEPQRERALASLLADGLVREAGAGYALPG